MRGARVCCRYSPRYGEPPGYGDPLEGVEVCDSDSWRDGAFIRRCRREGVDFAVLAIGVGSSGSSLEASGGDATACVDSGMLVESIREGSEEGCRCGGGG